ncbi:MAG: methyltransferase domain-containing protein [Victivallaceae bacterium]|jgi:ubiquinone/menaquinone biosynthesis C-methylase UbiE
MPDHTAGSYQFDKFDQQSSEFVILQRQAAAALALEHKIWQEAGLKPDMQVLDMGCGSGIISTHLAEYVRDGMVLGVDSSIALLHEAERLKVEKKLKNLKFRHGNVYEPGLPSGSFDFIYCRLLFQHLHEPEKALAALAGLLKPDGTVCIVDIDDDWLLLYPEPAELKSFISRSVEAQKADGGDRHAGRRLPAYLSSAGLKDVKAAVKVISSFELDLKRFMQLAFDFRIERLPEQDLKTARHELADIYAVLEQPSAWGAMGIFVATGKRPD